MVVKCQLICKYCKKQIGYIDLSDKLVDNINEDTKISAIIPHNKYVEIVFFCSENCKDLFMEDNDDKYLPIVINDNRYFKIGDYIYGNV